MTTNESLVPLPSCHHRPTCLGTHSWSKSGSLFPLSSLLASSDSCPLCHSNQCTLPADHPPLTLNTLQSSAYGSCVHIRPFPTTVIPNISLSFEFQQQSVSVSPSMYVRPCTVSLLSKCACDPNASKTSAFPLALNRISQTPTAHSSALPKRTQVC